MRIIRSIIATCLIVVALECSADIGVEHTRIVHSGQASMLVRIWNKGERNSLIQSWIDDGPAQAEGLEQIKVPYVVTSPLLRLGPGHNRDLVIKALPTKGLPQDRESVFWLNVLDVPASETAAAGHGRLDYAVNWRVKLFHRPAGLQGSADAAAAGLQWRVEKGESGSKRLVAVNRSPFHVSLASVRAGEQEVRLTPDAALVRPFSEWSAPWDDDRDTLAQVAFRWVDDKGKINDHASPLGH